MSDLTSNCKGNQSIERVYTYVKDYIHKNAMSPSVREICTGAGLKSTSSVHSYLRKLDECGRIEYRPGMRRAIIIKDFGSDFEYDDNTTASSETASSGK